MPPIKVDNLLKAQNNPLTRRALASEFIHGSIWPIFSQDLVAFSCQKPLELKLDNEKFICTQTLRFLPHPKRLELNHKELWVKVDNNPTLFLHQLIDWEFQDLDQNLPPIQIMSNNASNPHFFELFSFVISLFVKN